MKLLFAVLVVINGLGGWSTRIGFPGPATFTCPVRQLYPPPEPTIVPAGGFGYVDPACLGQGVLQIPAPSAARVDLFYRDGKTTSHVNVGPLPDVVEDNVFASISDSEQGTWINLVSTGLAFARVQVFSADGKHVKLEDQLVAVDGFAQYMVAVRPGPIIVEVTAGNDGFGHTTGAAIRGFATYGLRDGGSDVVFPLK